VGDGPGGADAAAGRYFKVARIDVLLVTCEIGADERSMKTRAVVDGVQGQTEREVEERFEDSEPRNVASREFGISLGSRM
jgi:hypothetical protein